MVFHKKKQKYLYGLKYDSTVTPGSLIPIILHEFHDSNGHQGMIHIFEAMRRIYWWPKLCKDIVKHINRCNICAKIYLIWPNTHDTWQYQCPNGSTGYRHYRLSASNIHREQMGFSSNLHTHTSCVHHTHERKIS